MTNQSASSVKSIFSEKFLSCGIKARYEIDNLKIWQLLVKVIDGGMGTELVRCGVEDVDKHKLWSALANVDFPESVVQARVGTDPTKKATWSLSGRVFPSHTTI